MDITTKNRTELKSYFEDNMIPTEEHFEFVFDGQLNMQEDNIAKVAGNPLSIQADSGSTEQNTLDLYADFTDTDPQWTLNLNPGSAGLNIKDGSTGLSRLFIDKGSGNIGIGTTTPTSGKFALKQTSNSSSGGYSTENIAGSVFLSQWASSGTASIATGNNSLNMITNGFTRLQIQSDGDIGIGTSPSLGKLHIRQDSDDVDEGLTVQGSAGQFLKSYIKGGDAQIETGANDFIFRTSGQDRMAIRADGHIGIGTLVPDLGKLHLLQDSDDENEGLTVEGAGGQFLKSYIKGGEAQVETGTNDIIFRTSGEDRMAIRVGGNIAIGTLVPDQGKLHVQQLLDSDVGGIAVVGTAGNYLRNVVTSGVARVKTGNNPLEFEVNGVNRLEVKPDGAIHVDGDFPIKRRRYTKTGSTTETLNIDTGFTVAGWTAIISSFSFMNHDIEETTTDYDFRVTVNPSGPNWVVNLGTELITSTTVDFLVDVVFFSNKLAESLPDVAL